MKCESNMKKLDIPTIIELESYPPDCNPMVHDHFNMGVGVSGPWMVMTDTHSGIKPDYNCSDEELKMKAEGKSVFYEDPTYLIFVNRRTGKRFKLDFIEHESGQ